MFLTRFISFVAAVASLELDLRYTIVATFFIPRCTTMAKVLLPSTIVRPPISDSSICKVPSATMRQAAISLTSDPFAQVESELVNTDDKESASSAEGDDK
jgi:hypothetical protein